MKSISHTISDLASIIKHISKSEGILSAIMWVVIIIIGFVLYYIIKAYLENRKKKLKK